MENGSVVFPPYNNPNGEMNEAQSEGNAPRDAGQYEVNANDLAEPLVVQNEELHGDVAEGRDMEGGGLLGGEGGIEHEGSASASEYVTASDSSLEGANNPWRMLAPDFCAWIDEWEEKLRVGMVVPERSTNVKMGVEGEHEEWGNTSEAIVLWNPSFPMVEDMQISPTNCTNSMLPVDNVHVEGMQIMDSATALVDALPPTEEILRSLVSNDGGLTRVPSSAKAAPLDWPLF